MSTPSRPFRLTTLVVPTRRLALALALVAPLWLLSAWPWGAWVAAAATLVVIALAAADLVTAPRHRDLDATRVAPETGGLGDPLPVRFQVRSRWARPLRATVFDALPPGLTREGAAPLAPAGTLRLEPNGEAEIPVTLVATARGRHALGPLAVRVRGWLGLVDRVHRWAPDDAIVIAPSIAGVRRYRLLALQHRLRDVGIRAQRRRGEGTSFAGLREYVPGDDPRRIDWKASARRQAVITREYTVERGQTVLIAVDAGRLMTQLAGEQPRFEHALSAALMLADVAASSGDHVGLLVFDDAVRAWVAPQKGAAALRLLREALIPVRPTMVEPDYAAAFRTLATRQRKRALVVLLTDVIDARASQAVLAHTARAAARHLLLTVALRNDALERAAQPGARTTSGGLYESAAAEELLSARAEALAAMRRAGVEVVDASPETLAAAVVNRYIAIKSRGAL